MNAPAYPASLRPLWTLAAWLGRSQDTLRDWYRDGDLEPRACDVQTRALLFDMQQAQRLHESRPTRAPRRRSERCLLSS